EQVVLKFSEGVEANFGAVRVFDTEGREVQEGNTFHPGDRNREVAVRLKPGLGDGGYTVTYRVVSADSHPISGGYVFVVGDAAAPSTTVGELLGGDDGAGAVTGVAFGVARASQYGSIALGLGALIFALACWLPGLRLVAGAGGGWSDASAAFGGRVRALLLVAAVAGVVSAATAIVLQGAVAGGTTFWEAANADVVGEVLGTRFGVFWGLGILAWALVGVLAAPPRVVPALQPAAVGATGLALPGSARLAALAVPLAALATLPALGGHASVQAPVAVLLPANVLHVLAMAAWLGGIAVLVVALRPATAKLEPGDRSRLLAAVVARFSTLAGIAVALLLASGIVQSVVEVRTLPNLVDSAFGRAVLIKAVLFTGLVAIGWVNRNRLLPGLRAAAQDGSSPGRAGLLLRRTLRAELAIGISALAVTGALAGYAPSISESSGPFSTTGDIGPARYEVTVDPAQTGPNEMHLYLFDRKDGSQWDETEELHVAAELPGKDIPAVDFDATKAGPGHYVVSGAAFGVAGDWKVEVRSRVSDFDEYSTEFTVPIE
ncbi:MAG TPA: CopD family protein, partial [Solirubrobacteraceae bacterium]|nr:CopD family protein [Solirubrobacteraceae bacterium]